jgi:mRNA interferase RelE/StbE
VPESDPEFEIRFGTSALKELRRLGRSAAAEIGSAIHEKLRRQPLSRGKPLAGELVGFRRLAVRRWRVVYRVLERRVLVLVLAVGKRAAGDREDVYDRLSRGELERRSAEFD